MIDIASFSLSKTNFSMKQTLVKPKHLLVLIGGLFFLQLQTAFAQTRGTWEKDTLMKYFPCITDVEKRWEGAALIQLYFDENCKSASTITPENMLKIYQGVLGEHDSLVLKRAWDSSPHRRRRGKDYDGRYSYQQYYKGYLVEGGGLNFNLYKNKVRRIADHLRRVDRDLPPKISIEEALGLVDSALAVKHPDRTLLPTTINHRSTKGYKAPYLYYYFEKAYLKEYKKNKHYYPLYIFGAVGWEPGLSYTIVVNPTSGEVVVNPALYLH
ncbi:MAG: hypothetical protein ACPGXL_09285 [Chitinophagales bacterium]